MSNIFVGNLSSNLTPDDLRTLFESYGAVEGIEIVTDLNTGYSRGFAFVGMTDDVDAAKAVSILDGTNVWGKPLKVEAARPQHRRSSSKSLDDRAWRKLYKAALFEVDKTKLPERIVQAEKALALKARELFYAAGDSIEEGQALDDAMYALHALRNTSHHCMPPVVAVV